MCAACSQRSSQFETTGIKDYNFAWKCHLEILLTRSYNSVKRLMRWIYTIFPPRVPNINLVYGLALHEFSAAQWIAWDRASSRCLGGHRFIFVPLSWHADYFIFAFDTELKIYHLSFFHYIMLDRREYLKLLQTSRSRTRFMSVCCQGKGPSIYSFRITCYRELWTIPSHDRVELALRNIDKSTNVQLLISFIFCLCMMLMKYSLIFI